MRPVWHDPLFAGDQRYNRGTAGRHDLVIDLTRQQTQRQPDHTCAIGQHPFDGVVGFAGVGRPKDRRYPGILGHDLSLTSLQALPLHLRCEAFNGFRCFLVMRVNGQHKPIGLQRQFVLFKLLKGHGQTKQ